MEVNLEYLFLIAERNLLKLLSSGENDFKNELPLKTGIGDVRFKRESILYCLGNDRYVVPFYDIHLKLFIPETSFKGKYNMILGVDYQPIDEFLVW